MGVYSRLVESRFTPPASDNDEQRSFPASDRANPEIGDVVTNVGHRIQQILDTAEQAAADIRAEAEAASASYVRERQYEADRLVEERAREFTNLTHSLSARIEGLQREASALADALEQARSSLAALGRVTAPEPAPEVPAPDPPSPPPEASRPNGQGDRIPEQAVLRATQMVVAGAERTEIERMLRVEFGVDDPASVVDEMLRVERA